jgi:hypothetical protein
MDQVYIREGRSEVLVVLDKHLPDRLTAMREAARILSREVIREESNSTRNAGWKSGDNIIPPHPGSDR